MVLKLGLPALTHALDRQGPVLRLVALRYSEFLPLRLHERASDLGDEGLQCLIFASECWYWP